MPLVGCVFLGITFPPVVMFLTLAFYIGLLFDPQLDQHLNTFLPVADGPAYAVGLLLIYAVVAILLLLVPGIYQWRKKMWLPSIINLGLALVISTIFFFPYFFLLMIE